TAPPTCSSRTPSWNRSRSRSVMPWCTGLSVRAPSPRFRVPGCGPESRSASRASAPRFPCSSPRACGAPERPQVVDPLSEFAQQLRDELNRLLAPAVRAHGPEALQRAEAVFAEILQQFREGPPRRPESGGELLAPRDRERYSEIIGDSPAMLHVF